MSQSIVFVSSRFGGGGAEKHLLRLINGLVSKGYEIELLLTQHNGEYEKFLNSKVKISYLSTGNTSYLWSLLKSVIPLMKFMRKGKHSEVVSVQDGPIIVAILARLLSPTKVKIYGWVQNNPTHLAASPSTKPYFWAIKLLYKRLDTLISLSKGVNQEYVKIAPELKNKYVIIPNIGFPESINHLKISDDSIPQLATDKINLVACGRLEPQKNYFMMLEALALARKEIDNLHLTIIGVGSLKTQINAYIEQKKLNENITLTGFINDPERVIAQARVFLLSSDFEGFGNVIVEAMASGVPVISTDCPFGPSEIIDNDIDGILVPVKSPEIMAEKIVNLVRDNKKLERLSHAGKAKAQRFTADVITTKFLKLIKSES